MNVKLFTTLGCHLCEEALTQLHHLRSQGLALNIEEVEIADSDDLMDKYGIRIPVIAMEDNQEIGWPFTTNELKAFLNGGNH